MFRRTSASFASKEPELLVGLDLGTSKITVAVAERDAASGEAQITGMGQAPTRGIKKGQIVNLDQAKQSIAEAVANAKSMVGVDLLEATVSFSGSEVQSIRSKGLVTLGRTQRPVKQVDINRLVEAAQNEVVLSISENQTILHTIPVEYKLDGTEGIDDPFGMNGTRLEIELESVIVSTSLVQNVMSCVQMAGLKVNGLVIKPLASALGALTQEEMNSSSGTICIDMGAGTCGVAVFADGRPKHLAITPYGGNNITSDVAQGLKIPLGLAETVKKDVDLWSEEALTHTEELEREYEGRVSHFSLSDLTETVQCRIEEIFDEFIIKDIKKKAELLPALNGTLVLTGGVSRSIGIEQFVPRWMNNMPVRLALPIDSHNMPPGMNGPEYTCASGVIRYILEKERDQFRYIDQIDNLPSAPTAQGTDKPQPSGDGRSIFQKVFDIIKDTF